MFRNSLKNRAVFEIIWKNMVESEMSQMKVRSTRISRWVPNAKNIHFWNMKQFLHIHCNTGGMLCDTYIACLVTFTEVKGRRLNFCLGIIYITLSKGLKFVKLHVCKNVNRQQAEVAQGVPGRLRPRIFLRFRTTRVVGCQPPLPQEKSLVIIFRG